METCKNFTSAHIGIKVLTTIGQYRYCQLYLKLSKNLFISSSWNSLDESMLLSVFQFGFRLKLSTELAATLFLNNFRKTLIKDYIVGAAFIRPSKAFYTISHSKLIAKLHSYGLNGTEPEWFTNYLFNQKALKYCSIDLSIIHRRFAVGGRRD